MKNSRLKNTQLALGMVFLCGSLAACKPNEPEPTPTPDVDAVTAQPAVEPAAEPAMVPDPAAEAQADAAATDAMGEEAEEDMPHSGGDKVSPASNQ